MNRVLGVIGSPRRHGNTDILVGRVLEGARDAGAETDALYLHEITIRECDGCQVCWKGRPCNKDDGMNAVYSRIIASDVIVFGTPVYWYGPTALMKAFLDRFVYFNCPENRAKIRGHAAALVVPYEEDSPETAEPLLKLFELSLRYLEMPLVGQLVVPGVGDRGAVLQKPDCLAEAFKLGRSLAAARRVV